MKRSQIIFLITWLSLVLSTAMHAQVSLEFGARAGFGFNGVSINGRADTSSNTTLLTPSFNLAVEFGILNRFFIQPELGFTQKGWRLGQDETLLGNNFYVERLNYRVLPILFKVAIRSTDEQTVMMYVGPSFNRLMSASEKLDIFGIEEEIEHDLDDPDSPYNRSEAALLLGVGIKAEAGPGNLVGDIRLSSSTSAYKELTETSSTTRFTNWTFNISLGYMLPLGKIIE